MTQIADAQFARVFLARLHAAANLHDADAVAALCCEDVVWDGRAASRPLQRREAVSRFHRETMSRALPDVRIEMIDGPYHALDGTGVLARLKISGTMTGPLVPLAFAPTNGSLVFETAEFSRFEGGLLSRHTVIIDMLGLARQIGAVPPLWIALRRRPRPRLGRVMFGVTAALLTLWPLWAAAQDYLFLFSILLGFWSWPGTAPASQARALRRQPSDRRRQ
ncbi:ester cyclase [Paracoccus sp. T5]|uniref:ester cyclase n=1 Tax=Paracoccus sp. T5 TaxID=3402161 RepID=UPI003AEE9721